MTTIVKTELDRPIESTDALITYLTGGERPQHQWGIGAESEKQVVIRDTGEAASYKNLQTLLQTLEKEPEWQRLNDGEALVGLKGIDSSVTLEPGGQLELSGRICPTIHCCQKELLLHTQEILQAGEPLNLLFLGIGVQPFTPLDQIELLPKERYGVMYPYMARAGTMGQRMMKQTSGLQVNLDFSNEADCIAKLQVAQMLAPLLYALFANSPIMEDKPTGFLSTRGEIWTHTDPDRTGLIDALFEEGAGYHTYVDYALDVPMYFIYRKGRMLDLTQQRFTFRQFMAEGFEDTRPLMTDWDLHLSTLFPEVRLRPQIEIRSADALPAKMTVAVATLIKGILYDHDAMAGVREALWLPDKTERDRVYRNSWRQGLKTPVGNRTLQDISLEILDLAREGLARQQRRTFIQDERPYLNEVQEIAETGVTLAERLLADWSPGDRKANLALLERHCSF